MPSLFTDIFSGHRILSNQVGFLQPTAGGRLLMLPSIIFVLSSLCARLGWGWEWGRG